MKVEVKDTMLMLRPETNRERQALDTLQRRGVDVSVGGAVTGLTTPAPHFFQLNITQPQLSVLMYVLGRSDEHVRSLPGNLSYPYKKLIEALAEAIGIHELGGQLVNPELIKPPKKPEEQEDEP